LQKQIRQRFNGLGQSQHLLLPQLIYLFVQQLDLKLRLDVDLVVIFCRHPVDILLSVLAHHDDWRRVGGLK
jgi:hypothetical protein